MTQQGSQLKVVNNAGAKEILYIRMMGGLKRRYASIGDTIVTTAKDAVPGSNARKGEAVKAMVVRTKKETHHEGGPYIRLNENVATILKNDEELCGTRIFGPIGRELREKKLMRIISFVSEVI